MRSIGISMISVGLTAGVIINAYFQKQQFYPSVVYITKSNPSMAVIYIQSLVFVLMLGKLMRKIFLGTLRAAEFEHLMERFWYALTETCLAFTVFRDDFNPKFVALFTVLLFLKSFHWLAEDRVDYMERSPVIGWLFHVRASGLLAVLALLDYMMISHAYHSTITKGATVQLVFGFEYAILITMVANVTIKYVLHAAELRSDAPWDNKAVFLLYTELVVGLIRVILYVLFVIIMVKIYTLPLFAFRPMYYTMRNFKKALNDVILSRRAIRNMNTLYPDATPEELALSDNICIICREDMVSSSKKLPCGHIFHTACLRSWFQRQQTCPTCRLNILRTTVPPTVQPPQPAVVPENNQNQGENIQNPAINPNMPVGPNPFANLMAPNLPPMNFGMPNMTQGSMPIGAALPPFPFMSPFPMAPPPIPPNLDTLTDEEIRALEGNERKHVEERIKLLRNIQLLLDASVSLMNQYSVITARLPIVPPVITPEIIPTVTTATVTSSQIVTEPVASTSKEIPNEGTSTVATQKSETSDKELTENDESMIEKLVRIEDVGSEEHIDDMSNKIEPISSSCNETNIIDAESNETANEIRRRRLEKFLKNENQSN